MTRSGLDHPWGPRDAAAHDGAWALTGDIARMSLASVLQFLELGRHTGTLVSGEPDERPGECLLNEGIIVAARHHHLVGPDAVIATLSRPKGRFAFSVAPFDVPEGPAMSASPLIMEAVRLEDEFERFSTGYPGDEFAMRLRDPHEFPTDPIGCGADVVMATLAARNGASVRQLLESVSLAPIKIRLAAAWLGYTDRLLERGGSRQNLPAMAEARLVWFNHLLLLFSGALRVVLAIDGRNGAHNVINSIKALAKALDSGPAWMSFGPDGTAMARVRPRTGGLLSIACVPMTEEREGAFKELAATADLVLLCADAPNQQIARWEAAAGRVAVLRFAAELKSSCLLDALERFASLLNEGLATRKMDVP